MQGPLEGHLTAKPQKSWKALQQQTWGSLSLRNRELTDKSNNKNSKRLAKQLIWQWPRCATVCPAHWLPETMWKESLPYLNTGSCSHWDFVAWDVNFCRNRIVTGNVTKEVYEVQPTVHLWKNWSQKYAPVLGNFCKSHPCLKRGANVLPAWVTGIKARSVNCRLQSSYHQVTCICFQLKNILLATESQYCVRGWEFKYEFKSLLGYKSF